MTKRRLGLVAALTTVSPLLGLQVARADTGYSQPAVFVRASNGEADVVVQSGLLNLDYYWAAPGGAWYSTTIASNVAYSTPAIFVRSSNNEADVVVQGPNNELLYYWATPGSKWQSSVVAGTGTTFSAPAIVVRSSGEADVVAQGPNNSLVYYWATPGSKWQSRTVAASGTTYSAPAMFVRSSNNEADIVAEGAGNSLLYYWATPGSGWQSTTIAGNGTTYSAPAIYVRSSTGEADIVAQGPSNSLYYYWATPGSHWNACEVASSGITSAPAIAVDSSNTAHVAVQGVSQEVGDALLHLYAAPGGSWHSSVIAENNTSFSAPSMFVRSSGEIDVVAADINDNPEYYFLQSSAPWRGSSTVPLLDYNAPLPVPPVKQTEGNWCWATSDQMILAYFGCPLSECQGATDMTTCQVNPPQDCCNPNNSGDATCNHTSGLHIDWYGCTYQNVGAALPFSTLQSQSAPVAANWNWNSSGSHFVVAIQAFTYGGTQYVTIDDPGSGDTSDVTYAYYVGGSSYDHTTGANTYDIQCPSNCYLDCSRQGG